VTAVVYGDLEVTERPARPIYHVVHKTPRGSGHMHRVRYIYIPISCTFPWVGHEFETRQTRLAAANLPSPRIYSYL
jgi:hypothetical protein